MTIYMGIVLEGGGSRSPCLLNPTMAVSVLSFSLLYMGQRVIFLLIRDDIIIILLLIMPSILRQSFGGNADGRGSFNTQLC